MDESVFVDQHQGILGHYDLYLQFMPHIHILVTTHGGVIKFFFMDASGIRDGRSLFKQNKNCYKNVLYLLITYL